MGGSSSSPELETIHPNPHMLLLQILVTPQSSVLLQISVLPKTYASTNMSLQTFVLPSSAFLQVYALVQENSLGSLTELGVCCYLLKL